MWRNRRQNGSETFDVATFCHIVFISTYLCPEAILGLLYWPLQLVARWKTFGWGEWERYIWPTKLDTSHPLDCLLLWQCDVGSSAIPKPSPFMNKNYSNLWIAYALLLFFRRTVIPYISETQISYTAFLLFSPFRNATYEKDFFFISCIIYVKSNIFSRQKIFWNITTIWRHKTLPLCYRNNNIVCDNNNSRCHVISVHYSCSRQFKCQRTFWG